jgi:hypothetical protein
MKPRILIYDIETSPNIIYSWAVGPKIKLSHDNIIEERKVICICWKWHGEKKVHSLDWGNKQDDRGLLKDFSKVYNSADATVAHNGDRYDHKFINGRLAFHSLKPLQDVPTIDTLKLSRQAFFINSHKLDYLGQFLTDKGKLDTGGFSLWKHVMEGDESAMKKMIRYCKRDVNLLEEVYDIIKPFAKHKLHFGYVSDKGELACKSCGSLKTKWDGIRPASKIKYRCRRCNDCGHFWRTNIRVE